MKYHTISNGFWNVSKPFIILTSVSVLDINDDDEKVVELVEEQDKILKDLGFNICSKTYNINFGGKRKNTQTIYEATQCLALKDGADLVQYENGNYGYVGYYAGINENWFEILGSTESEERENDLG